MHKDISKQQQPHLIFSHRPNVHGLRAPTSNVVWWRWRRLRPNDHCSRLLYDVAHTHVLVYTAASLTWSNLKAKRRVGKTKVHQSLETARMWLCMWASSGEYVFDGNALVFSCAKRILVRFMNVRLYLCGLAVAVCVHLSVGRCERVCEQIR